MNYTSPLLSPQEYVSQAHRRASHAYRALNTGRPIDKAESAALHMELDAAVDDYWDAYQALKKTTTRPVVICPQCGAVNRHRNYTTGGMHFSPEYGAWDDVEEHTVCECGAEIPEAAIIQPPSRVLVDEIPF